MSTALDDLLIHPKTRQQVILFGKKPSHALMIYGPAGAGKTSLAMASAGLVLGIDEVKLKNYPYFIFISKPEDKSEITINSIRELINKFSLKVPASHTEVQVKRVAIIDSAENLSNEAQNALLKILEEPPVDSLIILTADSQNGVLSTVASRTQKIAVLPVDLVESQDYFKSEHGDKPIESAWQLSQGSAGLMSAILAEKEHPLKQAVDRAKRFLSQSKYERLIELQKISKKREDFYIFLDGLARVLSALHKSNIKSNNLANQRKLLRARLIVHEIQDSADNNISLRLSGLWLVMNIGL